MPSGGLSDINAAKSFVSSWLAYGSIGRSRIRRAASNQRKNLEAVKWNYKHGIDPHWCCIADYEAAVEYLEAAARALLKRVKGE